MSSLRILAGRWHTLQKGMKKSWYVKSRGKLERIAIFYFGLLTLVFGYIIVTGTLRRNEFGSGDTLGLTIMISIFGIPVILGTLSKLLKSKVPVAVGIDSENKFMRIIFSKRDVVDIPFEQLGYAKAGEHQSHFALTIYKTFIGTRGQIVFKKIVELIGMPLTFSWKTKQIGEIVNELDRLEIPRTTAENRDLPLWERIISN